MSKSRSNKSANKDPKSGPGSRLIHLGRGQISISNYDGPGKKGRKQKRAVAAEGAKNLLTGYEKRAKAKKMKPPKSGGKPKRITTKNPPGGAYTPGAKAKKKRR